MAEEAGAKDKARGYAAPAIEKGFDVIELLADSPGGLTISEIAQRLGRSISELFRIIVVMERRRWLYKNPFSDRYTVTYRVLEVAYRATPAQALTLAAAPIMHDLTLATNQSCHLVVRAEGRGLVVLRQENAGPSGFAMRLGAVIDLVTSCSGHVLLAYTEEERLDAVLAHLPEPWAMPEEQLRKKLSAVRRRGYEKQPSARVAGVTDLSYPVFSLGGGIAAALTIPYILMIDGSQAHDLEGIRHLLGEAARRISSELGWSA
ncbi:IclR family transcriptional regulator [Sphingomonas sp.]|uniref:IclR family transcriptional regulator n=1 Tax=Sphingomonas sp. TaxID=28214 RepID=UPI000DB79F5E|nr:IclR family transcriptional regulator [Sphingomonas sp.]PZU10944.1 MAG: IclR family transcriptional regulator [Sphingomonas sp.]